MGRLAITPRVKRLAERAGLAAYVLLGVYLVASQLAGNLGRTVAPSAATASLAAASPSSPVATPLPSPSAPLTPAPTPTPAPLATPAPVVVAAYQNAGRHFAALTVPLGHALTSPVSGTASVVLYQFLGGQVRVGSNVPSEPFFPYVTITSDDRKIILRPGALDRDVKLSVKDGPVASGSPLFTIVGEGPSSWRTFYDAAVTAQVIASVTDRSTGAEIDPVPLFAP